MYPNLLYSPHSCRYPFGVVSTIDVTLIRQMIIVRILQMIRIPACEHKKSPSGKPSGDK